MSRKERGRRLASVEKCIDSLKQGYEEYIKKSKKDESLAKEEQIGKQQKPGNNCMDISRDKPVKTLIGRPGHDYKRKQLYGYFKQQTGEISHRKTWT